MPPENVDIQEGIGRLNLAYVDPNDRLYEPEEVDEAINRPVAPGSINKDFIQRKEEVQFAK